MDYPKPIAAAHTPEWHALREQGIGASEAATAAGLSRWDIPLRLYRRKRGELPAEEPSVAMRLGIMLEPVVATLWHQETGRSIGRPAPGLFRHPQYDRVLASPDEILNRDELLEIKTTTSRNEELGEEGTDQLPDEWIIQAQQQMAVMDAGACLFAVLVDGRDLKTYRVERREPLIDLLIESDMEFWRRVELGDPPPAPEDISYEQARRCFRRVLDGVTVQLSPKAAEIQYALDELNSEIRDLEKSKDEFRAQLVLEMGDAAVGIFPGGDWCLKRSETKPATIQRKGFISMRKVRVQE